MTDEPSPPAFATPLPQSPRSDILEWRFPPPYQHQYTLVGRSRAAWHTSFLVPQLNLLLDAGLVVNSLRPKHIFITHGHSDHTLLTPAFTKREDPPDIFCPVKVKRVLNDFLLAKTMLNRGGELDIGDAQDAGFDLDKVNRVNDDESGRSPEQLAWMGTHATHGVAAGETVPLRRLKNISATAFSCDHTVPCLGYVFASTTHRLRPEYASLPGPSLKALRQAGTPITAPAVTPIFAFLGDTTAATLAAAPDWLADGIPVVVTECSFLWAEHAAQAAKTKHTLWSDLEPVVRRWPATTFVLTHFSMRYTEAQVVRFFEDMDDAPRNIVVWADREAAQR
ncbi:hypothetical protein S40293_04334 [Stachybotrys chartarum IBT 40293]|nr:hypothetical protein S40293_04334 [Stachybotrys chartarum IBT 40293]